MRRSQLKPKLPPLEELVSLGRRLNLNVGTPKAERVLEGIAGAEGLVVVRDELGLSLDPKDYAHRHCRYCRGNGVVTTTRPVPLDHLNKLRKENPEALKAVETKWRKKKGKQVAVGHFVRSNRTCGCVEPRYQKARAKLQDALRAYA